MINKNKSKIYDILFIALLLASAGLLLWKTQFGYAMGDEAHYSATAYRIVRGDTLLVHERHRSQLFALLLYPFVSAFTKITGGTEGIIVAVRYFYIALLTLSTVFLYKRMKKANPLGGLFASSLLLFYIPNQILSVSYYTLGVIFTALTATVMAVPGKNKRLDYFLFGMFYAGTVVCNPLMVVLLPVFVVIRLCFAKKGKPLGKDDVFPVIGIFALAMPYLYHLLSSSSISEIINGLLGVIKAQSDVSLDIPLWQARFIILYRSIISMKSLAAYFVYTAIIVIVILIDKKRYCRRIFYFLLSAGVFAFLGIRVQTGCRYINLAILPFAFMGIIAFLLTGNKKYSRYLPFWIISGAYFACISYGSDQGFLSAVVGLFPAAVGGALSVADYICEVFIGKKEINTVITVTAGLLFFACTMSALVFDIKAGMYWDDTPACLDAQITSGPMKGIKTTRAKVDDYYYLYEQTEPVRNVKEGRVLYQTINEWLWLCDEKMPGTQSMWTMELEMQRDYYIEHPECVPDAVYIQYTFGEPEEIAEAIGAAVDDFEETESGYIFIRENTN